MASAPERHNAEVDEAAADITVAFLQEPTPAALACAAACLDVAGLTALIIAPRTTAVRTAAGEESAVPVTEVLPLGPAYVLRRTVALAASAAVVVVPGRRIRPGELSVALTAPLESPAVAAGSVVAARREVLAAALRTGLQPSDLRFPAALVARLTRNDEIGRRSSAARLISGPIGLLRTHLWPHRPSPMSIVELAPQAVRHVIGGARVRALPPSPPPKAHLMYRIGTDLVLHVYADPSSRLRRATAERELIRRDATIAGVPRLHVATEDRSAVWVVEDAVRGRQPAPRSAPAWSPRVASWLVGFAGPPGPPLASTPFWSAHRDEALTSAAPHHRAAVARAFAAIGDIRARHVHGDFQRRNIRIDGATVGAVDWEGAWQYGMPGLDIVFMALLARGDLPDAAVIAALAAGEEPPFVPLVEPLSQVGISGDLRPSAVLAMLALWNAGEVRRLARGGRAEAPRPYGDLLAAWVARPDRL
jgi:hypothetical protein